MATQLYALLAHARDVDSALRADLAEVAMASRPRGSVVVATCHRVELYGLAGDLEPFAAATRWSIANACAGESVARHLVRLAVGLESAVIGEDQVLHQLRGTLHDARVDGRVVPEVDRLFDVALRAGRLARSWLPAHRTNLADVALERVAGDARPGRVLIVGAGEMGRLAALAVRARGGQPVVASRTPEHAVALADRLGVASTSFVPATAELAGYAGVVIALAGRWPVRADVARSLANVGWVVDLSSPPAVSGELRALLGTRLTSIDQLAGDGSPRVPRRILERLETLADSAVDDYLRWAAAAGGRRAAQALRERAARLESTELAKLWRRVPDLSPVERDEIARAFNRVADGLLRDPLEQLGEDRDGRRTEAAQELFRL